MAMKTAEVEGITI